MGTFTRAVLGSLGGVGLGVVGVFAASFLKVLSLRANDENGAGVFFLIALGGGLGGLAGGVLFGSRGATWAWLLLGGITFLMTVGLLALGIRAHRSVPWSMDTLGKDLLTLALAPLLAGFSMGPIAAVFLWLSRQRSH